MPSIAIEPARVKTIRKARKFGRPKLAKLSRLTERQLAKIEQSASATLDLAVVEKLSNALQISSPTLTGEIEIIEADLQPFSAQKCNSGCCG